MFMLYVVIAFTWAAIAMYLILGGADFGAGILEFVSKKSLKKEISTIMYRSMGPIWEANHMWLIIFIVVMFVGFPPIYEVLSVNMHIPMILMLIGLITRGTAFIYRNYDAIDDGMQKVYSPVFTIASLLTPFFLGTIAGATVSGSIDNHATNFLDGYVYSWLSWFNVSVGIFTVLICGYVTAIFAIGQVESQKEKDYLVVLAKKFIIGLVAMGAVVFAIGYMHKVPVVNWVFGTLVGKISIALASVSLYFTFSSFKNDNPVLLRILAGFQIVMILLAVAFELFPNILTFKDGSKMSLLDSYGDMATINMLAWALLLGSIFILHRLFI